MIGVGEGPEDLKDFDAREFARGLMKFQPGAEDAGWLLRDAAGNGPAVVPGIEAAATSTARRCKGHCRPR